MRTADKKISKYDAVYEHHSRPSRDSQVDLKLESLIVRVVQRYLTA